MLWSCDLGCGVVTFIYLFLFFYFLFIYLFNLYLYIYIFFIFFLLLLLKSYLKNEISAKSLISLYYNLISFKLFFYS